MSNKRGKRGSSKKFSVQLDIRDTEQLQRTLDLRGVNGERPHINDIILKVCERLDEEERKRLLSTAKRWRGAWPPCMMYNCMGEEIYPVEDDDYDSYIDLKNSRKIKHLNKKLFKRKNKSKGRHGSEDDDFWANRHTMYNNNEWRDDLLDDEDNYEESYKCIKFYSDIENELSVREFYSLSDFNDFCSENNYFLSTTDYNNLLNWPVVHCCLDPISLEYGENEIITDNSYGALYWSVSDGSCSSSSDVHLGDTD